MWKDIKGFDGVYQVSDEGQVRRVFKSKTKPLKAWERGKYLTVCLSYGGDKKRFTVHRLVAETFLDKPENATEVNHIDGDKHNNNVSNLEWVTGRGNQVHMMENLKHYPFGKPAKKVRALDIETGETVAEFHSLADAAKFVGKISARTGITLCCQGYQTTAYGHRWEYIED